MVHSMMPGTEEQLQKEMTTAYVGIDPTADSLHIGHLVSIMLLKHLQAAGHKPIALVGGATGMIGDPSMKSAERNLLDEQTLNHNVACIKKQLERFLDFDSKEPNAAILVNNYEWMKGYSFINFIRDIGKHITVNYMMAKDSVKKRLSAESRECMSFTEFSYQLMQGYDFLYLNEHYGCKLQLGGSDQWGNITAGIDLIHKLEGADRPAFGLTIPLMLKADGTKFGKSAGGAVWLDPEKTSPYEFYQFWINQDDRDVVKYLKYFTFLSHEEIEDLAEKTEKEPWKRAAQKKLAEEVTKFVHGEAGLKEAQMITDALFSGDIKNLSVPQIEQGLKNAPSAEAGSEKKNLVDFLVDTKIEPSKRQAREDIKNGAIYVNGDREQSVDFDVDPSSAFDGKYVIIRKGKRKYTLVTIK